MGSIKLFADGTLGAHTAWMRRPYRDKPATRGVPVLDDKTLTHFVQKAAAGGMQVLVHAIGDAGIDAVISAFETVTSPGSNPLRHGIIHCQITSADLLERMARNRLLALVQPVFLEDDMHILERRVGPELAATSYAWGSMHRLGIPVSYSTDAPVSGMDPLHCIAWAVLLRDSAYTDPNGFYPGEQVDVHAAVDAYTAASSFSAFDEHHLGRIAPGYLADMVFLDRDIFAIPPEDIRKTRVLRTMCAGETVYRV
jgi:predicted amidohydrolase YtcJ